MVTLGRPPIWRDYTCPVCGKVERLNGVQLAHREQNKSCSVSCGLKLRARPVKPKRKNWSPSEQHRKSLSEALRRSPLTAAGETNLNAKERSLIAPDGSPYQFRNLALFVRKHEALFETDDIASIRAGRSFTTRAQIYLSRLRPTGKSQRLRLEWHFGARVRHDHSMSGTSLS